jgi:hypothetical protein
MRALAVTASLLLVASAAVVPAQAAVGPKWQIESIANTTAAPGSELGFTVKPFDAGDENIPPSPGGNHENCIPGAPAPADPAKCFTVTAHFPAGLKPIGATTEGPISGSCAALGASLKCSYPVYQEPLLKRTTTMFTINVRVRVGKEASGTLTSSFEVEGAEAGSARTVDPTTITAAPAQFGLDAIDALSAEGPSGAAFSKAGAHPYSATNWIDYSTHTEEPGILGLAFPVAALRDTVVDLPPGLIGNPSIARRCRSGDLANGTSPIAVDPLCPAESQVGRVSLKFASRGNPNVYPYLPLYNMVPPPGVAARFGFNFSGTMVLLDARPRQLPDGTWTVAVTSAQTSEGLGIPGVEVEVWGVPASPEHEAFRHCPGAGEEPSERHCPSEAPAEAFLRMPTSCSEAGRGLPWSVHVNSWSNPGATLPGGAPDLSDPAWKSMSIESHQAPGYPLSPEPSLPASSFPAGYSGPTEWGAPIGTEDCEEVPFEPTPHLQPTTPAADSPSGLQFEIQMPQHGLTEPEAIAESDLRDVRVKLPEGFSVNPSAANGREACSAAQIGLKSPVGQTPAIFSGGPQECPDASKVGAATIETPLLTEEESEAERPLHGAIYLAAQGENPFGSLLALYLVVEDPQSGTILKLPGEVKADPSTGQLETIFQDNPQLPFSGLHVELFGGPRAALRTPPACGTYHAQVTLTPWSGNPPAVFDEPIQISSGPGGSCPTGAFNPQLHAGTENPLAGTYSPFHLSLSREDGEAPLSGLRLALPKGLLAKLGGVAYCPDSTLAAIPSALGTGAAEVSHPSCPPASQVGTVTVGAGPGADPFYTRTGHAYWAGPYKGAPVSLAVVVPAVAGPFDLGNVVVRNGFQVDPETARITSVSDPFPTILDGIPLDVRDVRVDLDRPEYTLNPTSCEPMAFEGEISSPTGQSAKSSPRFQVAGCEALSFKPKLSLKLRGKTNRGATPALKAVLSMPGGGANTAGARVTLPPSEFVDNAHFSNVCTRVQYAAGGGGGAECPKGSAYGYARVYSPILDYYLRGPVYLRSAPSRELPDLVASLDGVIHVDVVGHIDSFHGGLRTTFESVPDAPVSKFVLEMQGGKKGLIQNSTDLCRGTHRAIAEFTAQNGKVADLRPPLEAACGKAARHGHHHGYRHGY